MAQQILLSSQFQTIELEIIHSIKELIEEVKILNSKIDLAEIESKTLHTEIEETIKRAESSV